MAIQPRVALTVDFMRSFSNLPRTKQKKVREFVQKFQSNPTSPGINFEKLQHVVDSKVRSVRIDQEYRGIVLHPEVGNVYVLAWVDHHDAAIDWARERKFEINPVTGAFQIIPTETGLERIGGTILEETATKGAGPVSPIPMFQGVGDDALISLGVPSPLIAIIRHIVREDQLEALSTAFPGEVSDALFLLGAGASVEEILAERKKTGQIAELGAETVDFEGALEHPDSKRWLRVIEGPMALSEILAAPLDLWRVFLHPSQESLVKRHFKGPARAFGGAGTGKTVVAMHRAQHLAKEVFTEPTDRILVTTYTRNLAEAIGTNLGNLCGEEFERIDVASLDSWANITLRSLGVEFKLLAKDSDRRDYWAEAESAVDTGGLSLDFLMDEYEAVILSQGIESLGEYIKADRAGRGIPLRRSQRIVAWGMFEEYRNLLQASNAFEYEDVIRELRKRLEDEKQDKPPLPYRTVIVDEVQDMSPERLRLVRAIVPRGENDIFLAGDPHQRIYGRPLVFSRLGIEVRGRSSKLRVNYRTTGAIRRYSMHVLKGVDFDDMDGGSEGQAGTYAIREGTTPRIVHLSDEVAQLKFLTQELNSVISNGTAPESICVCAARNALVKELHTYCSNSGIEGIILDPRHKQTDLGGIRLATFHRVKGLEFTHVFVAHANKGEIPRPFDGNPEDKVRRREHDARQRSMFHVVCTRARDELTIMSCREPSEFIK
jgi:hypothetical protein